MESLFIDETKLESRANKYKFVWKKAVTKQQQKILDRLPGFIEEIEEAFGLRVRIGPTPAAVPPEAYPSEIEGTPEGKRNHLRPWTGKEKAPPTEDGRNTGRVHPQAKGLHPEDPYCGRQKQLCQDGS